MLNLYMNFYMNMSNMSYHMADLGPINKLLIGNIYVTNSMSQPDVLMPPMTILKTISFVNHDSN